MKTYDAVVIGAATTGSYFARKLAERGHSVLVLDVKPEKQVGARYDIFHIPKKDFARFNLPLPEEGKDKAFEFSRSRAYSALGNHPKLTNETVIGMHMHEYTLRLNRWAKDAGAKFVYSAGFAGYIMDEGRIQGVRYEKDGKTQEVGARIVADCSGIASVARRALPDGYGVENFEIKPSEMFYVTLRYVKYSDPADYLDGSRGWSFYKAWEAPSHDPTGAILGVGAGVSYDAGEQVFKTFENTVKLPPYTIDHIERGVTPYRRPPYSFVADGFVACGDAACLTKPSAGEGVTSAMVHMDIACGIINDLLDRKDYLTRAAMWGINQRYNLSQGKTFASLLATLADAVASNAIENDFFFEKDIIFTKRTFELMGESKPLEFTKKQIRQMALKMVGGVLAGKLRIKTIKSLLRGMNNGDIMLAHYAAYPDSPEGFDEWAARADVLWSECASMIEA